ncbi:hypothetical protein MKW94_000217 [Papaver nudicaule]|uniref:Bet v I/Major latex protein domain-containing protein n=1 Tax=Papaver nudicaule TaxID=74823 RepID=A0AA41VEJ7_PAPNU|nr:hypothetical protein [Papaver nudicaule]
MAQIRKLESVYEIKCCADKFYQMCTRDAHQIPKYAPKTIKSVQVIGEGEVRVGTGFVWQFVPVGGSTILTIKDTITAVDNKNRSITFTVMEGELMTVFKSFRVNLDVTPKDGATDGTSLAKWSVEYEKAHEDVPDPVGVIKSCEEITTGLNLHLLKQV